MEYLVTADEMQKLDRTTIETIGIPAMVLMERAALAVYEEVLRFCPKRILILCGCGNNGADGLALARLLSEAGLAVNVMICGDRGRATQQWKTQFMILKHYPVSVFTVKNNITDTGSKIPYEEYDILVDSLFGVGLNRKISGFYAAVIEWFNSAKGKKVAVDIPSGIHSDTGKVMGYAVSADLTVSFSYGKRGLYFYPGCEFAGKVVVKDIGISEKAMITFKPEMFRYTENPAFLMPKRTESGNKGTFGKALIAAGSKNMAGAAVLSALGCYRAGTGMVKILTKECNRQILQTAVPEALLDTSFTENKEWFLWPDALAVGPGLGTDARAYDILKIFIENTALPLVIDADGLNLLSMHEELKQALCRQTKSGRTVVLTPHVGELSRLTGRSILEIKESPAEIAIEIAKELQCIIVSKDARTLTCCDMQPICMNTAGNSGMATAGSGDVLTGIITGLLAQGMSGFDAAAVGVYLHGLAGDAAANKYGKYSMMAKDIADALSDVIRQ